MITPTALLLSASLAGPAWAGDVFLYYNSTYITAANVRDLVNAMEGVGASVDTSTSSSWRTSYSGYKMAIFLLPAATFNSTQGSALTSLVSGGGRVVVAGDWQSGAGGFVTESTHANTMLSRMGVSARVGSTTVAGTGCTSSSMSIASDQLTDGVSSLSIAASNSVSGGTTLLSHSGTVVLAVDQPSSVSDGRTPYDVLVSGDVNLFLNDCSGSTSTGANWTLWENLYLGLCQDGDGDGFKDADCGGDDCDDSRASVYPGASETCNSRDDDCDGTVDEDAADRSTWYRDADSDLYGNLSITSLSCTKPGGYVADSTDCDDSDAGINPGASEVPYDGLDQDCDGADLTDVDGDGFDCDCVSGGTDCNDNDSSTWPGATEGADGRDNDCDSTVDEGTSWYDDDGDGFTEDAGDCDDGDASEHPGATERCDGDDDDCDGTVDEGTDCADDDGDGYTEAEGDCHDGDAAINPGEAEIAGNGIDDDCDGTVDDGAYDGDGDGFTASAGDCDDADPAVFPGAAELPDGKDNDCDGRTDEGTVAYDDDGDGWSEAAGDCHDGDAGISPDAEEIPDNGVDDDCDEQVDEGGDGYDNDGDGFSVYGGDCDDVDPAVNPGAQEIAGNGVDDDCDGVVDGAAAGDEDSDGYSSADGDCDDDDGWVNPASPEFCDGVDNDCDGVVDEDCEEIVPIGDEALKGTCACAASPLSPRGGWFGLLALAWLGLRRRRPGPGCRSLSL